MRLIDMTGWVFGRLTVIERVGTDRTPSGMTFPTWSCQCACGAMTIVRGAHLRNSHISSCGCYRREVTSARSRLEVVDYNAAHARAMRAKGKASTHPCEHCGEPALDWAYDNADPDELVGSALSRAPGSPFSLNPDHYRPLCRPCHRIADNARSRSIRE